MLIDALLALKPTFRLGRYLAKCAREVRSGRNSNGSDKSIMYLYETHKMRSNFDSKVPKEQQWQQIQEAFEHLSQRIIMKTFDSLEVRRRQDKQEVAWNKVSVQMTKVGLLVPCLGGIYFLFK